MKTVNVREVRASLADLLEQAQREPILITRHGKPMVLLTGVEGADLGSVILEGSKAFWQEIERRRASTGPRRTHEEMLTKYSVEPAPGRQPSKRARKATG